MLSIIIPTFNEIKNQVIQKSFQSLSNLNGIEVIIVDSYSTDGTIELANRYNYKIIKTNSMSRAVRLNLGIQSASHDTLILYHPRSILDIKAIEYLKINPTKGWGAFTHEFDEDSVMLGFTSYYSNYIRGARGIFYLDHCIYVNKSLLESVGNLTEVDIFEDTELSIKLKKECNPILLPFKSVTSAIRFKKNGFLKQALLNQVLKVKYYFRINHKKMNQSYEKGLELNSNYNNKESEKENCN